jgi:hypothetical protein
MAHIEVIALKMSMRMRSQSALLMTDHLENGPISAEARNGANQLLLPTSAKSSIITPEWCRDRMNGL